MTHELLSAEVQHFILLHEQEDEKKLVLKHKKILGVASVHIAEQIVGRRKAKTKLPIFYNTPNLLYPRSINLEQCSSEITSQFKAEILSGLPSRKIVADLTGGFGVDSFFLSKVFKQVHYVEPDTSLAELSQHNHRVLQANNIFHHHTTAEAFINQQTEKFDCIFLDPSRRSRSNQKVFRLADCEPNAPALLPALFRVTEHILLKASPLLDLKAGILEIQGVQKIFIVAVENECKELLFLCKKGFTGEPEIIAINLQTNREEFSFSPSAEVSAESKFSNPQTYLYEPNAAITKAGAFKLVGKRFSMAKLHTNTHLYTSNEIVQLFPGRIFKIIKTVKPDRKALQQVFTQGKANIITRNFPLSPEALKKKTHLKDGGDLYLLGFTSLNEKLLIAAQRLK